MRRTDASLLPGSAGWEGPPLGGLEVLLGVKGRWCSCYVLPSYPLGSTPLALLPALPFRRSFRGGDGLAYDAYGGQFVPLIGVISATVTGEVKRNEKVKKEDTTVHHTPAAAEKKGNSSPSLWGG